MFSLDKNKPTKERTDKQTNGQRDKGTNGKHRSRNKLTNRKKMNEPFICRKRSATANTKLIQQLQN
jgi:hypothetical protein